MAVRDLVAAPALAAVERFSLGLQTIPETRRLWAHKETGTVQLWVLLSVATPETRRLVYALERDLLGSIGDESIVVHVCGINELDPSSLPDGETIFERP